jgi:hypothetical protein
MYYKIENKECEIYKKLHLMRTEEIQIGKENEKTLDEKIGLKFETYLGHHGQQNFRRTTQYIGFEFTEPEKVDMKLWQKHKEHSGIFIPNKRTKAGRDMAEFLANGLKSSHYKKPIQILGLPEQRRFTIPFVEIVGDLILIYLDNNSEPKDENIIEITKREFEQLSNLEI